MGSQTTRLKLFKPDPSIGSTDPVDVDLDLAANYDLIDDHAMIRSRDAGVFPTDGYVGGMLYHAASGTISSYRDSGTYKTIKSLNSYVEATGNANANIPSGVDVQLAWGHSEDRDSLAFESGGSIRIKKPGLYYTSCSFKLTNDAAVYERFLMIRVVNATGAGQFRFSQNHTQGNDTWCTVGGFLRADASRVGWKLQACIYQNSGATIFYTDLLSSFMAIRLGGYDG